MLRVTVDRGSRLVFSCPGVEGEFAVTFQRTLRIPDDGQAYPLPPGLGTFPVRRVLAYKDRVPAEWVKTSGVFLPMYQREAMWLSFGSRHWRPNAVKVAAGKVNAVSGKPWDQSLAAPAREGGRDVQDYLVCDPQPWIDGFNTGADTVRQFVAMPLGMGYTVEGQVTGREKHGGVQLIVYEPKPGRFADQAPPPPPALWRSVSGGSEAMFYAPAMEGDDFDDTTTDFDPLEPVKGINISGRGRAMGLAAGGAIEQKIYPDPHGLDAWDASNYGRVFVHLVNSMMWREITGEEPPPTPVTAKSYTAAGYPWFDLYDEHLGDVPASSVFAGVKSVAAMDAEHGFVGVDDDTVDVPPGQRTALHHPDEVHDGTW